MYRDQDYKHVNMSAQIRPRGVLTLTTDLEGHFAMEQLGLAIAPSVSNSPSPP